MNETSFLPGFGSFVKNTLQTLCACTLHGLEDRLGSFLPKNLLPVASARERPFSERRTFWCLTLQMLAGHASCDKIVREVQALFAASHQGRKHISSCNSAFCQARARLPEGKLHTAIEHTAKTASQLAPSEELIPGKRLLLIDGTTLTLPDTPENQKQFTQPRFQKKGCGFPIVRMLCLCLLKGGGVLKIALGNYRHHELRLMQEFLPLIGKGDLTVIDRIAGNFVVAAQMLSRGADFVSRVYKRKIDFRSAHKKLGKNDGLFVWKKGAVRSPYLTPEQWNELPEQITVRIIRIQVRRKGFRTRRIELVTTLIDPNAHPASQIANAYLHRWKIELCMDDLKTTLGMDRLRCLKPETIKREILGMIIAHNFLRCLMAKAARAHAAPLYRISFKGTIDTFMSFTPALVRASKTKRAAIWDEMLRILATHLIPERPGRREPRVVKRRPKAFPRMSKPRHQYCNFRAINF
jgi:hypothetical protein